MLYGEIKAVISSSTHIFIGPHCLVLLALSATPIRANASIIGMYILVNNCMHMHMHVWICESEGMSEQVNVYYKVYLDFLEYYN